MCAQILWSRQILSHYGISQRGVIVYCDKRSATYISKHLVQHSHTINIDIRHKYIHDLVESKHIILEHVTINSQLVVLFTKALDSQQFKCL